MLDGDVLSPVPFLRRHMKHSPHNACHAQPSEVIVITQSCSGNLRSHGGLPKIGPFLVGKCWT